MCITASPLPAASPASDHSTASPPRPACALWPAGEGSRRAGPPAERRAQPPPSPAERLPRRGASCQRSPGAPSLERGERDGERGEHRP